MLCLTDATHFAKQQTLCSNLCDTPRQNKQQPSALTPDGCSKVGAAFQTKRSGKGLLIKVLAQALQACKNQLAGHANDIITWAAKE